MATPKMAPPSSSSKGSKRPRRDADASAAADADEGPAAPRAAAAEPAAGPAAARSPAAAPSPAAASKKPKKGSSAYWSSLGGWRAVPVTDHELFLGADEGGFGGLEELDPRGVDAAKLAELDAQARVLFGGRAGGVRGGADGDGGDGDSPAGATVVTPGRGGGAKAKLSKKGKKEDKTGKKGQKQPQHQAGEKGKRAGAGAGAAADADGSANPASSRKERRAAERKAYREESLRRRADERRARRAEAREAREGGGEDVKALRARLAALERENARLKQKKEAAAGEGGGDDGSEQDEGDDDDDAEHESGDAEMVPAAAAAAGPDSDDSDSELDDDDETDDDDEAPAAIPIDATAAAAAPVDTAAWRRAFPGGWLHPSLERALGEAGFSAPTPVQAAAVPGAARDRRDVICAAQTGSGKTLAFGLPILQRLLEERDRRQKKKRGGGGGAGGQDADADAAADDDGAGAKDKKLRALILAPTRELGLQVAAHLAALAAPLGLRVAALVGGLAVPKQERLLARRPEVVVATPGRLWDLMRQAHPHVSDLSGLSFLVIDEADRMVQRGHYAELGGILDLVPRGGAATSGGGGGGNGGAAGRKRPSNNGNGNGNGNATKGGLDDEEVPAMPQDDGDGEQVRFAASDGAAAAGGDPSASAAPQTMVFSATLTLPASLRKRLRKGGGGQSGAATLDALMDRVPFRTAASAGGRAPLVVDLTTKRRLADRVHEACVRCATDARRDAALALFLSAHPGRCVVFVNAVSSLRRLAALLRLLGLPAQALHAQQQQRQRLKALDRFRASEQAVLVATDVAARGLDVKGVESVVHYQLPASADTYIHRCGRAGRTGGGEGLSLALVTPQEAARWRALRFALASSEEMGGGGAQGQQQQHDDEPAPCPEFPLDAALLREAERRLAIAEKVDALERGARKRRADGAWARTAAAAAGLALSDEEDAKAGEDEDADAERRGAASLSPREATELARLRSQLAAAVAAPLQPSVSRRFFAGGGSGEMLLRAAAARGKGGGGGAAGADADAAAAEAVDLATRLAANAASAKRDGGSAAAAAAAAAGAGAGASGGGGGSKSSKREQEKQRRAAEQRRQLKLDRLMLSNNERKRRRRAAAQGTGRGMVVIGRPNVGGSSVASMAAASAGRQRGGPTALAALRASSSSFGGDAAAAAVE